MGGWWRGAAAGGLVLATCLVFAPALECGFVHVDDPAYVTANPVVRQGLALESVRAVVTRHTASMWVPLAMVSHLADVSLWGLDPWGHHLTSVLLHGATVGLLFLVLHAMTGAPWRSAAAALLFGLHPLRVESVVWIAERKDVLSGLLAVLAVEAYRRWTLRPSAGRQAVTCGLLALGILAKPMLVTLPALFLLLDVWPLGRTAVPWRRRLFEKAPLAAVVVAGSVATVAVVGGTGGMLSLTELPLGDRLENAAVSYVRYVGLTLAPRDLAVYYPRPDAWPLAVVVVSMLVLAALAVVAIATRRRAPWVLVGLGWFAVALAPVIGIAQAGAQAMADRFTYLPAIGLAVAIVWTLGDLVGRRQRLVPVAGACAALALVLLSGATRAQIAHWRTDRTLFEHTLSVTDRNWFAHAVYADALRAEGALAEAAAHYARALAIEPGLTKVHAGLGAVRRDEGDVAAAIHHLAEALRLDPTNEPAATHLVQAFVEHGLAPVTAQEAVATLRHGVAAARRDRARPQGEGYYASLTRHLMTAHSETVGRCREDAGPADPFDLFVTVGPDGQVTSASTTPPSALGACIAGRLAGSRLPAPPFGPFHARVWMNLAG